MPAILVNDVSPVISYVATAAQTLFAVPFEFFNVADIIVERAGVQLAYSPSPANNNQYSVTGANAEGGGSITLGGAGAIAGETIVVYRDIAIERLANYPETGPMAVRSLNAEQAKHIGMMQQLERDIGRSVTVPIGESSIDIPTAANRANKYLFFDNVGNPEVSTGVSTDPSLRVELAASSGSTLVGSNDGASGTLWTTVAGFIAYLRSSIGSSIVGFLQAGTGAVVRTAQDKMRENRTVRDYGAATDGTTNARPAFVLADAVGPMVISEGNYLISSSITITNNVRFSKGAKLIIPTGVTVTFNGHVDAGVFQIFQCTGTGAVVLSADKNFVGYAEWWGAVANISSGGVPAANSIAINAAIVALAKVQLMPFDYYISATIKHNTANGWLCGAGGKWNSPNGLRATRIVMMDGSTNVLQIGPDSNPGSIGLFRQGIKVTGIFVTRAVAPVISSACASILMQFVLEAYCEDVAAYDSMDSWQFNGTVHCIINRCAAHRVSAGTGGTDSWKGFNVIGTSGIAAGGNASLYLSYCHADDNRTSVVNGIGFFANGKFTDCFWIECETVSCTVGMQVIGNSAATNDFGGNDLMILHSINDAFKVYGIEIKDLGVSSNVEVVAPYCGPGVGSTAAIKIANAYGVVVTGGQMIMGVATGASAAIRIENSKSCVIDGTLISEITLAGVVVDTCTSCNISPVLKNSTVSGAEAIYIFGASTANKFNAIVSGNASGFTYGYRVNGTTDARNEYNCTGINSAVIAGGSGNKLERNGVQITATGLTGTNLASGVMT